MVARTRRRAEKQEISSAPGYRDELKREMIEAGLLSWQRLGHPHGSQEAQMMNEVNER